jgi:hypothetical protein
LHILALFSLIFFCLHPWFIWTDNPRQQSNTTTWFLQLDMARFSVAQFLLMAACLAALGVQKCQPQCCIWTALFAGTRQLKREDKQKMEPSDRTKSIKVYKHPQFQMFQDERFAPVDFVFLNCWTRGTEWLSAKSRKMLILQIL